MENKDKRLFESRFTRRTVLRAGLGAFGVVIGRSFQREVYAQDRPVFAPQPEAPWVEPTDIDYILKIAAEEMGLSEDYVKRIVGCESQFDPTVINPVSGARGLWQIMPLHAEKFTAREWNYWEDWSNPYRNTKVAEDILAEQGLAAWDCS